ncbi:FecR family protein [Chitinophaga jiangningensis]|nr:FecR domain-containing protein [Chitinophaga jiangningensis]
MSIREEQAMDLARIAAKIREGRPTTPEEQELWHRWLGESASNQQLMEQLQNTNWLAAQLRQFDEVDTAAATTAIFTKLGIKEKQPRIRMSYIWRAAAAVLLLLCATMIVHYRTANHPVKPITAVSTGNGRATLTLADGDRVELDAAMDGAITNQEGAVVTKSGKTLDYSSTAASKAVMNELSTPGGSQFELRLPDGTKVWLNSASSLVFPTAFTGYERVVKLRGEAYFEVAQDARHPFKVFVNQTMIEVLGTGFNVNAYTDEANILTTLASGKVRVTAGKANVTLAPGQQAVTDMANENIYVRPADIRKATAWKNGMFEFTDTDLPTILREIARWYNVRIVYQTTAVNSRYGGGIGRNQQLADVLAMLEASGPNRFRIAGDTVFVLSTSQP